MKRKRTIFGKRRVDLAGVLYEVRLECDALVVHQFHKRTWIRVPLARLVGSVMGVIPFTAPEVEAPA